MFPSIEGLSVTDKGEYIYGGSVAINRILEMLRSQAYVHNRHEWKVYLINMLTIVEGCYSPSISLKDLHERVSTDTQLLTTYIQAYSELEKPKPQSVFVLFYYPEYTHLPKDLLRTPSEKSTIIDDLYRKLRGGVSPGGMDHQYDHVWVGYTRVGSTSIFPHKDLERLLGKMNAKAPYALSLYPIAMISSYVLDLHLFRSGYKGHLLERYTGKLKAPSEFGTKIHPDGRLPFTPVTHLAFGDDKLIAPKVKGRPRTAILERAVKEHWSTKTDEQIKSLLLNTPDLKLTSQDLTRIRF